MACEAEGRASLGRSWGVSSGSRGNRPDFRVLHGERGNEQREGAAATVSLHDTVGVTTLGGNGPHRPQGFPEWLPLTCRDVLTSWPARWTPSPGRRSSISETPAGYRDEARYIISLCSRA
jgi:hypothetical protein